MVRDFVIRKQEEHLYLDFKTINREDLSHGDDKRSLAKALSGFANSDGGVVVWGIDARPNAEGIDCAVGFKHIADLPRVLSRLNDLTGEFVTPSVDGVRHRSIVLEGGKGCAITLVPVSDSGPHMAKAGENRYFKRSGSSFYCMEHFDLEDMFGRRRRPILSLVHRFSGGGGSSGGGVTSHVGHVVLRLTNLGRAVARSPYVIVGFSHPYTVDPHAPSGLPRLQPTMSRVHQFGANSSIVIHPGMFLDVAAIRYEVVNDRGTVVLPVPMIIQYQLAAEDMRITDGELTLSSEDLLHGRFPDGTVPLKL